MMTVQKRIAVLALAAVTAGCAGPVAERAFNDVAATTEQRIGQRPAWIKSDDDERAVRETLDRLLARPLTADDAVQVALLNNRRLQGSFAELGIGAADLTASWRPANPSLSYARLRRGNETEIDRGISIDAFSLLLLPFAAGIEERRYEATKLRTATAVLSLAAQTRKAWYEAVAAEQTAVYVGQIRDAAETQAELARRMKQVGNASALRLLREQIFYADATARLAKSRVMAVAARERLTRLMGLWGRDTAFQLPDRLPDIPAVPRSVDNIEAQAIAGRLDVQMAKADLAATRKAYGLTNATRFINVLEVGYQRNSETGKADQKGYEIALEVPLFDFGDARATRAEHVYLQAVNTLADTAVQARSAARENYLAYRAAYDLSRHYQTEIIPLRQKASEEMVLRYNGMLISTFELLADAREQIADVSAALEAQRDFWIADTDLSFVTIAPVDSGGMAGSGNSLLPRRAASVAH
ncbi:TolC family protein [Ferrovibrio terrae]|uniref:TolC family protein n=1 Tax=Ferrovibrio terrae TaxID=2594003 RepID=UPI003138416C